MLVISDFLKIIIFYIVTIWLAAGKNYKILKLYKGYSFLITGFILLCLSGTIEFLSEHTLWFLLRNIQFIISLGYIVSIIVILTGTVIFITSFVRLHNIEEQYKDLSLKLEAVFESSTNYIILTKPDGTITMFNKQMRQKFITDSNISHIKLWDIPCLKESDDVRNIIRQNVEAMIKYVRKEAKISLTDKEGDTLIFKIIFTPVTDEKGNLIYILTEGIDITAIEKTFQELSQIQKMETIGTMASGIAHDLNNTLSGITGSLSIIDILFQENETVAADDIQEHIATIKHSADRMSYLIGQFLNLSRKQEEYKETVDLKSVLDHIYNMGITTFDKSVQFRLDCPDTECYIHGNRHLLEQAVLNICLNAVQSMTVMRKEKKDWGGKLQIHVRKKVFLDKKLMPFPELEKGTYWEIDISDTGIGMNEDLKKKIFDPFFTTKKQAEGLGLGLTMAYKIIRQHKGAVNVYSEEGYGTTFHIYLPAEKDVSRRSVAVKPEPVIFGKGGILLVDDEKILLKIGKIILEKSGYTVLTAETGEKALEIYKQQKENIDLVILDMVMPKLSGLVVFEILTSINPDVKVILSSGIENDKRIKTVMDMGAKGFLKKPFSAFQLTDLIKKILSEQE